MDDCEFSGWNFDDSVFLDDHLVVGLFGNNGLVGTKTKMAEHGWDMWSQNLVGAEN